MLYSTGAVQVFVGYVTTLAGATSSVQISQRRSVTPSKPTPVVDGPAVVNLPAPVPEGTPPDIAVQNKPDIIPNINMDAAVDPVPGNPQDDAQFFPLAAPLLFGMPNAQPSKSYGALSVGGGGSSYRTRITPTFQVVAVPYYLGTCEQMPTIEVRPNYRPIYINDVGKKVPYDLLYEGKDAILSMTLNNFSEYLHAIIGGRTNARVPGGGPRGIDLYDSIGSLILSEGLSLMVWLQFPNAAKPAMAQGGLPPGWRFFACTLLAPDRIEPGLRPKKIRLVFHALKLYDFVSGNQFLFDHDMSSIGQLQTVYA